MPEKMGRGKWLRKELRLILKRGRQVWRLIPPRFKWALGGAAAIMALTSAVNTAIPLFLGHLVDEVIHGTEEQWSHEAMYRVAALYLGLIGACYLVRELLQVVR